MMETQSTTIHLLSVAASASNMTTGFMFEEDEEGNILGARSCGQCLPEIDSSMDEVSLILARQNDSMVAMWGDWKYHGHMVSTSK